VPSDGPWLPLDGRRFSQAFPTDVSLTPDVVLVFDAALLPERSLLSRLQTRARARPCGPFRDVAEISEEIDMVVAAGPGSPTASVTMELLAAHGVKRVVSVGTAAATCDATSDGQVCLVARATLAAATSPYPGDGGLRCGPLFDQLRSAADAQAAALTTLWPFRVDASEVATHAGAVIEMEAATLHAVAEVVGVTIESLVVISDRYRADGWQVGDATQTRSGLDRAVEIAVAGLNTTR